MKSKKTDVWGIHTTSNPLPLNILSVVATTFPPFRCRSHIIFRRDTCGNICCILSTSASLARMLFADVAFRLCEDDAELDEKKKYRIARPPSRSSISSCGIFIVCSSMVGAVVRGWGFVCNQDVGLESEGPKCSSCWG